MLVFQKVFIDCLQFNWVHKLWETLPRVESLKVAISKAKGNLKKCQIYHLAAGL